MSYLPLTLDIRNVRSMRDINAKEAMSNGFELNSGDGDSDGGCFIVVVSSKITIFSTVTKVLVNVISAIVPADVEGVDEVGIFDVVEVVLVPESVVLVLVSSFSGGIDTLRSRFMSPASHSAVWSALTLLI